MKKLNAFIGIILILLSLQFSFGQNGRPGFELMGTDPETIEINQNFSETAEIYEFDANMPGIFGLSINADISFENEKGLVRVILTDKQYNEYLLFETYPLLDSDIPFSVQNFSEETGIMNAIKPQSVRIEIENATVFINSFNYARGMSPGTRVAELRREKKQVQNAEKIRKLNANLEARGLMWAAGPTGVSELSYAERKQLYGQGTFPPGFEYYAGGVISAGDRTKSAAAESMMVDSWDWRARHGKNWITKVTNQGSCGSCWAFAATGATEAMVNVFFNQLLNLDLSEQDILSCSGAGSCAGGYPGTALNYITNTGIVDEATFKYTATDQPCSNKGTNPTQLIKIGGKVDFGSTAYPRSEDDLKRMIIEMGPVSGGLYDWSHAMTLVGYKVVEEEDYFYYRDLNLSRYWKTVEAGDPLIGKTVWIFKNSWGAGFGDAGYVYVETPISNFGWTHGVKTPVQSLIQNYNVICEDADGDGYYWWGLGPKPEGCNCPDQADGDDSDPNLGPLDQYGNCTILGGPPVAAFTASTTSVTAGGQVTFTDQSNGGATSWSWEFAGGNPSSSALQNPVIQYNTPGTYTVKLTAGNTYGSDVEEKINYITVTLPPPVADFSSDITTVWMGENVAFTDQSTGDPATWSWTFQGGVPATSDLKDPVVRYDDYGSYQVSLTVTNAGGSSTKTVSDYITVTDGMLHYCDSYGDAGYEWISSVAINSDNFNSPSPYTAGYEDFTEKKTFNLEPGTYNISLTPGFAGRSKFEYWAVWIDFNNDGDFSDSGEQLINGLRGKSNVSGSITIPSGINAETRMRVSMARSIITSPCGNIGQGQVEDYAVMIGEPTPQPPVAAFAANSTNITVGSIVQFTDLSANNPISWTWSFPGGTPSTSTSQHPSVEYSTVGTYNVTLTAGNALGSDTETKTGFITVTEQVIQDYCEPVNINNGSDFINTVSIGSFSNTTGKGSNGYMLYVSPDCALTAGGNYTVSLTPNTTNTRNFWRLWIDFNGDGDFDDSDETLVTGNNKKGGFSTSISIPAYASGQTRMRISMRVNSSQSSCDDGFIGEVEDYTVDFGNGKSGLFAGDSELGQGEHSMLVYPNPGSDKLFIELDGWEGEKVIRLIDMTGRTVLRKTLSESRLVIDVSSLPKGIYLIDANNGILVENRKIIIN